MAGLDDLLPPDRRGHSLTIDAAPGTTVKDLAESLGGPHTEIAAIVVNGVSVDLGYQVCADDRIRVYPVSEAPELWPLVRLDPPTPQPPRFALDVHLGRLARTSITCPY
jgi:uncharacterized protein